MTTKNLGDQVSVKVGAQIIGVHKQIPACAIVLESNPTMILVVPQSYVEYCEEPTTIPDQKDMLMQALNSPEEWEMIEEMGNPFMHTTDEEE